MARAGFPRWGGYHPRSKKAHVRPDKIGRQCASFCAKSSFWNAYLRQIQEPSEAEPALKDLVLVTLPRQAEVLRV